MASALRAPIPSHEGIYFSASLHARSYISRAGIATALLPPFSTRVGRSVAKQRAQQVPSFRAQLPEFNVKLFTRGGEKNMKMAGHKHILGEALKEGIEVPYKKSCQSGRCYNCIGKLINGSVEHSEQFVLESDDLDNGYVVLCRAKPKSDVEIETRIDKRVLF